MNKGKHTNSVMVALLTTAAIYVVAHRWPQAMHSVIWTRSSHNNVSMTAIANTPGPGAQQNG